VEPEQEGRGKRMGEGGRGKEEWFSNWLLLYTKPCIDWRCVCGITTHAGTGRKALKKLYVSYDLYGRRLADSSTVIVGTARGSTVYSWKMDGTA
jgi:hypothetical protein